MFTRRLLALLLCLLGAAHARVLQTTPLSLASRMAIVRGDLSVDDSVLELVRAPGAPKAAPKAAQVARAPRARAPAGRRTAHDRVRVPRGGATAEPNPLFEQFFQCSI